MSTPKSILYIAMTLDGYIATEDNDLSFLEAYNDGPDDYGYHDFIEKVGTIIMGRKTYDIIQGFDIEWPHKKEKCYVLSNSKSGKDENVEFYNGSLPDLISSIKQENSGDIFIDGGAEVVKQFALNGLIDLYIISMLPVLLGSGIRLFKDGRPSQDLEHIKTESYKNGLVQLWYSNKSS